MTRGLSDSLTTMSSWLRWAAVAMVEAKPMACGQRATNSPLRSSSSGWLVSIIKTSPPTAGGQDRPAARPARRHDHPGWGDPALARTARRLQPTYAALVCGAQASPVVATDETGWRVGGRCRATNGW
jgi:hypothetical protein